MTKFNCKRLMMDNDKSHHAKIAVASMVENNVEYSLPPPPPCHNQRCRCKPPDDFWFPAYSPDLAPAELYNNYVQQELDKMTQRLGHPATIQRLKSRVKQIVTKTPKSYFKNLMAGMPARVQRVYEARGKY